MKVITLMQLPQHYVIMTPSLLVIVVIVVAVGAVVAVVVSKVSINRYHIRYDLHSYYVHIYR